MTYPLIKKTTNGVNESRQVSKQGIRVSPRESVESDGEKSELPENFGEIVKGIYRSSFPQNWNLPALESLGLRTIITLVDEQYTQSYESFIKENGIKHHIVPFIANKDPAVKTPDCVVNVILRIMLNKSNHPILIHCNKGKHRTGCVTACFRKLQGWDGQKIMEEYVRYSRPKQRVLDEVFIREYDPSMLSNLAQISGAKTWASSGIYVNIRHEEDQNSPKKLLHLPYNGIRVKVST
ncbi:tyrosine phosphatase family protein [Aspergillus undulatus]|uniref:tyrosine phosphatase family protein n=1 Tax=Aspergillus undulatus TaxID=1810928 RepID=UPI003CCCAE47